MKSLIFIFCFVLSLHIQANDGLTLVAVGKAEKENERISILPAKIKSTLSVTQKKALNELMQLFVNDFKFYRKSFYVEGIEGAGPPSNDENLIKPNFSVWKQSKYLVQILVTPLGNDLDLQTALYRVENQELLLSRQIIIPLTMLRERGHELTDEWYRKITGKTSIFKSKLLFVSDRTGPRRDPYKELYIMDFDGHNKKQLTFHKATVISPSLSYDHKKVLYSVIKRSKSRKNVDLYLLNLDTGKSQLISGKEGINSGAVFLPGDQEILLTLTYAGNNADIYKMNLNSRKITQITKLSSTDVDPSISVDGSLMTFLSDRPGKAMIYTADPRGVERSVKRISYVGKFNATPRFSPDGKEIVFSSWLDERFDIFRINSDGTGLARLTKNFGSNEDPTYSNDGEFIAFSSQRVLSAKQATHNIYIMDKDGDILGPVTQDYGKCISPRWSK